MTTSGLTVRSTSKTTGSPWTPDRRDVIWINFSPQTGREFSVMHPMMVLSPRAFNLRTSIVIGLPMSTAAYNATNPFAVNNSKTAKEPSYIICNQPKSLDWRTRGAKPHPSGRVRESVFQLACAELNDIVQLVAS
jgi:mRNA interferase MazF